MRLVRQHEYLSEDGIMVIECSQQYNIRLINDANPHSFKNGGRHSYHGGASDRFSAKIRVPSIGFWNVIIDTVTRCPTSVMCRLNFKWPIKFVHRSGSQFI